MFNYLSLYGYTVSQKLWLLAGLLLALASIISFAFDKKRWSVALLTAGGFCLFVFAAKYHQQQEHRSNQESIPVLPDPLP